VNITRDPWRDVGLRAGAPTVKVEIICSDAVEHRRHVETRKADIPGHKQPTWEYVCNRWVEPWVRTLIVIDAAGRTVEDCLAELPR
jgi:hypothetical protein